MSDGVLGTQTWGVRMEGADKSTELWRHPATSICYEASYRHFLSARLAATFI